MSFCFVGARTPHRVFEIISDVSTARGVYADIFTVKPIVYFKKFTYFKSFILKRCKSVFRNSVHMKRILREVFININLYHINISKLLHIEVPRKPTEFDTMYGFCFSKRSVYLPSSCTLFLFGSVQFVAINITSTAPTTAAAD